MTDTRAPVAADLIIRHGYVITMDDASRILEDGAIAIRDGRILAVGPDAEIAARYAAGRVVDARRRLVDAPRERRQGDDAPK